MRAKSIYNDMFEKQLLMECYRGSKSHNLYVPPEDKMGTDDIDLINVYCYPLHYYLTLEGYYRAKGVYEAQGEFDVVGYEIKKMFHLLKGLNPNVLATLYVRKEDYLTLTPAWQIVLDNREIFTSKRLIFATYGGYARAQFKKMHHYSKEGYMGEKRMNLVNKFGYDTKNASHCIRLIKMGIEFLRDGQPQVWRIKDKEQLLSIKRGEWDLERIKHYVEQLFSELEKEAKKSKLPPDNNKTKINKLLYEVMQEAL